MQTGKLRISAQELASTLTILACCMCKLLDPKELKVFVSQEIGRNLCAQVKLKGRMCDSYLLTDGMSIA